MNHSINIIRLRNRAVIWSGIAVIAILGAWFGSKMMQQLSVNNRTEVATLERTAHNIRYEGVNTDKDWSTFPTVNEQNVQRWSTISTLAPNIAKVVGLGTPSYSHNLQKIYTLIGKNDSEKTYVEWLKLSWSNVDNASLEKIQNDIAEVIPVFTGNTFGIASEYIGGRITLTTLIQYVQTYLVDAFQLGNVLGNIGIDRVTFDEFIPDIGIYEVTLRFEGVSNKYIYQLFDFFNKTGGVEITKDENNRIILSHRSPINGISTSQNQLSKLTNLLIIPKNITIQSAGEGSDTSPLRLNTEQLWNVDMTLNFFIRGASKEHVAQIDQKLTQLLEAKGSTGGLATQARTARTQCGNTCPDRVGLDDIISLLQKTQTTYKTLLEKEKTEKNETSPLETIQTRMEILTLVNNLEYKLTKIISRLQ